MCKQQGTITRLQMTLIDINKGQINVDKAKGYERHVKLAHGLIHLKLK